MYGEVFPFCLILLLSVIADILKIPSKEGEKYTLQMLIGCRSSSVNLI